MITQKTKLFAGLSSLILCVMCVTIFFLIRHITIQEDKLFYKINAVTNYSMQKQSYRKLLSLSDDMETDREELLSYFLTEDKVVNFLTTIEEIAMEQGVDLITSSLKVENTDNYIDYLKISFEVKGARSRIYTLLGILEKLPYNSLVSSILLYNDSETDIKVMGGNIQLTVSFLQYD